METLVNTILTSAPIANPTSTQILDAEVAEFIKFADWYSGLGQRFAPAIEIRPYDDPTLPHFRALTPDARQRVLTSLRSTCEIWAESIRDIESGLVGAEMEISKDVADMDPVDEVRLVQSRALWRTLSKNGFRFPSDLFVSIGHHDVVEVYTADSLQVFRSLHFFKVCSYSLEQIYCIPWFDLYQRDAIANQQSLELLARAITGELRGMVHEERDSHYVYESLPGHGLKTRIKPGALCFFENDARELSGYLHSFRVVPGEQSWI